MKPEQYPEAESLLFKRRDVAAREGYIQDLEERKRDLIERSHDAVTEIDSIYGLGDGVVNETAVVVLERRVDEGAGDYAIVAKIEIEQSLEHERADEEPREIEDVRITVGAAFDHEPAFPITDEEELGEGINGKVWRGHWMDHETTGNMDHLKKGLADCRSNVMSEQHRNAVGSLNAVGESVERILEAARDEELNPRATEKAATAA